MIRDFSLPAFYMGLLAAFVGNAKLKSGFISDKGGL